MCDGRGGCENGVTAPTLASVGQKLWRRERGLVRSRTVRWGRVGTREHQLLSHTELLVPLTTFGGKKEPQQACPFFDSSWPHPRCSGKRAAQTARQVIGLELDTEGHRLFVAFSGCIIYLPLSRCARHGACRR